jgi:hypothetical protein
MLDPELFARLVKQQVAAAGGARDCHHGAVRATESCWTVSQIATLAVLCLRTTCGSIGPSRADPTAEGQGLFRPHPAHHNVARFVGAGLVLRDQVRAIREDGVGGPHDSEALVHVVLAEAVKNGLRAQSSHHRTSNRDF